MSSMARTYFHELYEGDADPWEFATSGYEQRKYSLTVASLPRGLHIGLRAGLFHWRSDREARPPL